MKRKKITKVATLICTVASSLLMIATPLNPVYAQVSTTTYTEDTQSSRSAIIGWRYKTVDGVLYKRLYNYSNDTWIGDWIVV